VGQPETEPHREILLFASIHHVLAVEEIFMRGELWCDLVPVPRGLSSDCGMAIEFRAEDREAVCEALAAFGVRPLGMYRREGGVYREASE